MPCFINTILSDEKKNCNKFHVNIPEINPWLVEVVEGEGGIVDEQTLLHDDDELHCVPSTLCIVLIN